MNETRKRSVTGDSDKLELAFEVAIWLGWMNSALNPIIYYSNQEVSIEMIISELQTIYNSSIFIVCVDFCSVHVAAYVM